MNALISMLVLAQQAIGAAKPAPELQLDHWLNAEKTPRVADFHGKVVLLVINPGFC
jgi:hypothetical protein